MENLKQKNLLSVLGVSEVQWKGQGEISGVYTVYYSRGKSAEFSVAIVVHKSIMRSDVKKIVSDDSIVAPKLRAGPVSFL